MKKNPFYKKVIWITGASSGIGEALTYAFHEKGACLILSSRNVKKLEKVRSRCTKSNTDIYLLPFNLSELESLNETVDTALSYCGNIDFMIHNAGVALRDLVINTAIEVDHTIMKVNYLGPIAITKRLLPSMIKNKSGHFVVISSLSGKYGVPRLSAYAASKQALHGFFDSLRSEVYNDNIKITIIIPGIINTAITAHALRGDGTKYGKIEEIQLRGMAPQKCAEKILHVVSNGKEEALIGGPEILTVYIRRLFPQIFSKIIRNHPIKKLKQVGKIFK